MEQGNEGDAIILLALRQIDCQFSESIDSVGKLTPDAIIEIVARSLWLISNGEIKFPVSLPANIASRHRTCTDMAMKVKELGYSGDCGYNQLLYPVEAQTRALLTWIVQRLPRTEEEQAEEELGVNALQNRRMMEKLVSWKQAPWILPFCSTGTGSSTRNAYNKSTLRTISTGINGDDIGIKKIFSMCRDGGVTSEPSFFERHTTELVQDALYAARLENSFGDNDTDDAKKKTAKSEALEAAIRNAIGNARQSYGGVGGGDHTSGTDDNTLSELRQQAQLNMSLSELIASITKDAYDAESAKGKLERGTRFSHATEFAQEAVISAVGGHGSGGMLGAIAGKESETPEEAAARRQKQEEEEKEREAELETLKKQVHDGQSVIETNERLLYNATSKMRQLESELAALLAEGDNYERELTVKKKTLEMLPSAVDNIAKLQVICGASAKRMMTLAQEWESHRRPLVAQLRAKRSSKAARRQKCRLMVEEMKKCREDMINMVQDLKDKQERSQLLTEEMQKLPKNINRALYTHRIMDIIAQITKQKKDIDKITDDIRTIQKTINSTQQAMQRADAVAEELVYSAANASGSDPATVETYRRLRALRAKFDDLIATVGKIGQAEKASRDLETKVDQEINRVSSNNVDRIKADLDSVIKENAQLVAKIKASQKK